MCLLIKHLYQGLRKWAEEMRAGGLCPFLQNSWALRECGCLLCRYILSPNPIQEEASPHQGSPTGGAQLFPHDAQEEEDRRQAWLACQGWQLGTQMGVGQRLNVPGEGCRQPTEARQGQGWCSPSPLCVSGTLNATPPVSSRQPLEVFSSSTSGPEK